MQIPKDSQSVRSVKNPFYLTTHYYRQTQKKPKKFSQKASIPRSPVSLRISRTGETQLLRLESFKCFLMSPSFNSEIRLSIETNTKDHNR
ncbi:hypothetical protein OIU76_010374 [Salix suchowensis]|nr:hypothetical protein OIU76_010374 [Salix suchowensis]